MGGDSKRYLRAADAIPQGGLSAIAGEAISDADAARLFHKHVAFRENERFLGMQGGSVDGYQLRGATAFEKFNSDLARRNAQGNRSQTFDTLMHLALLDNLDAQITVLDNRITQYATGFEVQYGPDWREHMAQRILDPDDFPQRRDGESLEDYHQRLEAALIGEMLDEDGNIKPEYANDPEMAEWALWAKDRYDRQQALRDRNYLDDPSIDETERARRREEVASGASFQEREKLRNQTADLETHAALDAADDVEKDNAGLSASVVAADSAFLS